MAMQKHKLSCTDEKELHKTQSLYSAVCMLGFFINLVSLLINSTIVPYLDVKMNLMLGRQMPGQEPGFDWRTSASPLVRWLTLIMQIAHFCLAFFQFTLLSTHPTCFREEGREAGKITTDGQRLFVLGLAQVGFIIVFSILKLRLSSLTELMENRL